MKTLTIKDNTHTYSESYTNTIDVWKVAMFVALEKISHLYPECKLEIIPRKKISLYHKEIGNIEIIIGGEDEK